MFRETYPIVKIFKISKNNSWTSPQVPLMSSDCGIYNLGDFGMFPITPDEVVFNKGWDLEPIKKIVVRRSWFFCVGRWKQLEENPSSFPDRRNFQPWWNHPMRGRVEMGRNTSLSWVFDYAPLRSLTYVSSKGTFLSRWFSLKTVWLHMYGDVRQFPIGFAVICCTCLWEVILADWTRKVDRR